ncbi:hypothetical protein Dimus_027737 [Dionaea muscipula]
MGVVDMSKPPPTKDFFPSPALSLSLAGIFRGAAAAAAAEGGGSGAAGEEGDEGSVGGGGGMRGRREETVEISSENSGPVRSRSGEDDEEDGDDGGGDGSKKKRKRYHRHTAEQIREMEALFKDSPHPDEKQRQQLSKQLGLHPRQVKFWFQNRRTQIKAIQERHENSLLKTEIDKLKEESKTLRDSIQKSSCPNCGFATTGKDATVAAEDQQLRIENTKLKAEVEKLRAIVGKRPPGTSSPSSSCSAGDDQENKSPPNFYPGVFGIDRSKIIDTVNQALEELQKMATAGEPLWVRSVETGREILNYDEYMKEFSVERMSNGTPKRSIEASRETGVVFVDLPRLIQSFMDVNLWKEMFPCLISKAATVDVIVSGEAANKSGAVQLMFAELQMITPMVPTREVYFVRYCKQLSPEQWAIVDVSIDKVEDNIDTSLVKCRKRPSGCIIEDKANGHCKVTWVEHLECQKSTVHSMYRTIVSSGLAFGARHWVATLQLQCERLVFFMATNVPTKDSNGSIVLYDPAFHFVEVSDYHLAIFFHLKSSPTNSHTGVATLAGRKSILKLAQRMTWSFCQALGASSFNSWRKVTSKTGEDIRVSSRKNLNDPGEPIGVILCAVSSVWLPVSPSILFDFLRDDARRHEWDIMADGGQVQSIASLAKGQDRGNAVTVQAIRSKENGVWLIQDCCTNAYESMVVYAQVDISGMQSVMTGCDSGSIAVLPSGFSILPDGLESRPHVITSRQEEKSTEGGSLLTIGIQIVTNASPTAKVSLEIPEPITALISCTLRSIKTSFQSQEPHSPNALSLLLRFEGKAKLHRDRLNSLGRIPDDDWGGDGEESLGLADGSTLLELNPITNLERVIRVMGLTTLPCIVFIALMMGKAVEVGFDGEREEGGSEERLVRKGERFGEEPWKVDEEKYDDGGRGGLRRVNVRDIFGGFQDEEGERREGLMLILLYLLQGERRTFIGLSSGPMGFGPIELAKLPGLEENQNQSLEDRLIQLDFHMSASEGISYPFQLQGR